MLNETFSVIFKHCDTSFSKYTCESAWIRLKCWGLSNWIYDLSNPNFFFALKSNFYSMHLYFSFFALTQGVFADFLAFSNYWGKNCSEATERILKSPKYFCLTLFENNSKCRIWIFVLLKLIDLVTLLNFDFFSKNRKNFHLNFWILAFFTNFCTQVW